MPGTAPLTAEQPWRGSEPYTEADRAWFHGRKRETEELRHLLQRGTLTVLTGAAGTGKTSLIRAGLLPSLSPDCMPVPLVLDWAAASDQRPLSRQVIEAIEAAALARGIEGPKSNPADSLWEVFHRTGARWWNARQRPVTPLLVIDQFEDAFAAGAASATMQRHRDRFIEELSQLAANHPPVRVASRIEDGTERDDAFDFGSVPLRILLVFREDSLPQFAALRLPVHGELRLAAFTEAQARDVLIRAAMQRGLFAEGVVDQLLPRLAAGNDREHPFAPATLSAQAHELAALRASRNATHITADFFAPAQPAAEAPAVAKIPEHETAPRTHGKLVFVLIAALLIVSAAKFPWQRPEPAPPAEATVAPEPRDEPPAVQATPVPEPPPTPQPVVALPTPAPAPPPPAPPTPMPVVVAPTPVPTPTPAPTPAPTPMPPAPPPTAEPEGTTAIVPATPPPPPAVIPAPKSAGPARSRERPQRTESAPPRRPPTSAIQPNVPARTPPARKPAFAPGGGG